MIPILRPQDIALAVRRTAEAELIMYEMGPWFWTKLRQPLSQRAAISA